MKRKSTNYASAKAGGWVRQSDDLFLAQFRGKPCEICGRERGFDNGKNIRSMGHHLIFKGRCREHRYNPLNIIVLCPFHHSHYNSECSPHSITNTHAQTAFEHWVRDNKPDQYRWWMDHQKDADKPYSGTITPREQYELLGGEIRKTDKEGNNLPMKDWKPMNHKKNVDKSM